MPSRASRAKFQDTTVIQILQEYVSRNLTVTVSLEYPSKEVRTQMCHAAGLQENQLRQWFSRAKRKCGPDVMGKYAITRIFAKGGEYSSTVPNRGIVGTQPAKMERMLPARSLPSRAQPYRAARPVRHVRAAAPSKQTYPKRQDSSFLNGKPSRIKKVEPFDEVQLATLEQSWHKGLLKNPMNYLPISSITGITTDSVKAWAENRVMLGNEQFFYPEQKHFDELTNRLGAMGLLQNPGFKQLLNILTDCKSEDDSTDELARAIVIQNAKRSGVLFDPANHADIAALMKVDLPEVQRLAVFHSKPKKEPVKKPKEEPVGEEKYGDKEEDPDWTPPQSMRIKKEPIEMKPGWKTRSSLRSQANSNIEVDKRIEGPPTKRRRSLSYETTSLLNLAWNTQVILKKEYHDVIAAMGDITPQQLKTWFFHKKQRNPGVQPPMAMGIPGSKRFSDQQTTILSRAFERNLLTGENLPLIAELAQINVKQIRTWIAHRKQRGPTTK